MIPPQKNLEVGQKINDILDVKTRNRILQEIEVLKSKIGGLSSRSPEEEYFVTCVIIYLKERSKIKIFSQTLSPVKTSIKKAFP